MKFEKDIDRDVVMLKAHLAGGFEAACSAAMEMGGFSGPDDVLAYGRWIGKRTPEMAAYRQEVASKVLKEIAS